MSTKMKAIIAAVLALCGAAFGWYVAYSDGDPATTPNTGAVVSAGANVIQAVTKPEDTGSSTGATAVETKPDVPVTDGKTDAQRLDDLGL